MPRSGYELFNELIVEFVTKIEQKCLPHGFLPSLFRNYESSSASHFMQFLCLAFKKELKNLKLSPQLLLHNMKFTEGFYLKI